MSKKFNLYYNMKQLIDIITEKLVLSKHNNINDERHEYFYHEALEDGYTTKFITYMQNVLQYSIDECNTWNDLNPNKETPEINKGERIYFKGEHMIVDSNGIGRFESNKKFNAGGNIMSLIYGDNFIGKTKLLNGFQFSRLFSKNSKLITTKNLVLPAIELTGCCYKYMFNECTALIEAPELPTTKLSYGCYEGMFAKCTSLIKSSKLPAMKLVDKCYYYMFYGCTSLNEITMLATDISATGCLYFCFYDISETGTFTKAKDANISTGIDGIPEGWTIKEI